MELNSDICYQALLSHDTRFDGVFFVGVSSTGIYCRPICPVKTPRRANCAFYPSPAAAEQGGYRPCLRCRPELAPGNASVDAISRLAASAASRIEDGILTEKSVAELALEIGISDRHLRRVIESEFGVSPIALAQTQRLLLAKRLLTDTRLSVTDVAFASGFSSTRRLNTLFKERYRLNPTQLRKTRRADTPLDTLVCELAYRPPFDWLSLLGFLGTRATLGVESRLGNRYLRTVAIGKHMGWLAVEPCRSKHTVQVTLSASLAPVLSSVLSRTKRLFDLAAEPLQIASDLGLLAAECPGLRVPGAFDPFELAIRAILGQQISVKAAATMHARFVNAFGVPIDTPFPDCLTHLSPSAEMIARVETSELVKLGIIPARAKTITELAKALSAGEIDLSPGADVQETSHRLKNIAGIGEWTAQYIAMRALGWPDAFPHTDLAIGKALNETHPKRILEIAEAWRPWRSYAVIHLWRSLEKKNLEAAAL